MLNELLETFGWDSGFRVPVANVENLQLQNELRALLEQRAHLQTQLNDAHEHHANVNNHARNVIRQRDEEKKYLNTLKLHAETKKHALKTNEQTRDGLTHELKNVEKTYTRARDNVHAARDTLVRKLSRVDALKTCVQYDAELLTLYETNLADASTRNHVIEKFSADDIASVKQLTHERAQLHATQTTRVTQLKQTMDAVQAEQVTLANIQRAIRDAQSRKAALMHAWNRMLAFLHARNAREKHTRDVSGKLSQEYRAKMADVQAARDTFETYVNEKRHACVMLRDVEAEIARANAELDAIRSCVADFQVETVVVKRGVSKVGKDLEDARVRDKWILECIARDNRKHAELSRYTNEQHVTHEIYRSGTLTSNELVQELSKKFKHLTRIVAETHARNECILRDISRVTTRTAAVNDNERVTINAIKAYEQTLKNLETRERARHDDLEKYRVVTQKNASTAEVLRGKITQMQARRDTNADDEVARALNEQALLLRADCQAKCAVRAVLRQEIAQLADDLRVVGGHLERVERKLHDMESKTKDVKLAIEVNEKFACKLRAQRQELLVTENVLRLRYKQRTQFLTRGDDLLTNLHQQQTTLDVDIAARQLDIDTHRAQLHHQRKQLQTERAQIRVDIQRLHARCDQLKTRYDLAIGAIERTDTGEPVTITHVTIEYLQRKRALHEQGDRLNRAIHTAEGEIVALENAFRVVDAATAMFRRNLTAVERDSATAREMDALLDAYNDALRDVKNFRVMRDNVEERIKHLDESIEDARHMESDVIAARNAIEDEWYAITRYVDEQRPKIARADQIVRKYIREMRARHMSLQLSDFITWDMQRQSARCLRDVMTFVVEHAAVQNEFNRLITSARVNTHAQYLRMTRTENVTSNSSVSSAEER